jgi:branched-subunit amino acid ABC-type transport system permease component/ABC-type branched-subunit amino acid transport system substrate-binding protein
MPSCQRGRPPRSARRRAIAAAILLLLGAVTALVACKPKVDDIPVGAYLSLTGADSTFGTDTRDGIALAIEQVNAAGGVHGKPIRIIYEDDKSSSQEAANKVRQLIDRDGAVAILGEVASSRSLAGGLICNTKKIPMVTPSSTAVDVTEGREYVFRTCFTDAQQGEVAARFVRETLKKDRAAIFYAAQDNYSSGLADTFKSAFVSMGGTIAIEKGYQKGETKFTTYLAAIKASGAEVIFAPVYYNDMAQIGPQAAQVGIASSAFVGGDGWDSDDILETAGAELDGSFFTNAYAPDVPWPNSAAFVKAFVGKYGHVPGALAAQGYDGARLLADAIARAPRVTPEAIKVALAETKGFAGATGVLTIDAHHDANKPVCIVQIKDKAFHFFSELTSQSTGSAPHAAQEEPHDDTPLTSRLAAAVVTGLAQGAMIALVALGYTMVYGVLRLINFAHSEVFMMGAYAGLFAIGALGGSMHPALAGALGTVLAMAAASLLGISIERVAYRPLRKRGKGPLARVTPLVTALGVSVLLQNVAQLCFTARFRPYPKLIPTSATVRFGPVTLGGSSLLIFAVTVTVMVLLELLVKRTWFGKAMRALSANEEAARLMGIHTSGVIARTFALGSSLAALGAVLYCLDQSQVYPTMGVVIGTRAFVAAVLGGIGSITGAMLGGLLLGVLGELVKLSDWSGGVDVLVFLVLIGVLLVRPAGLLGSTRAEKV